MLQVWGVSSTDTRIPEFGKLLGVADEFFMNEVLGQAISGRWEEALCHDYIDRESDSYFYARICKSIPGLQSRYEICQAQQLPV